jgi:hypothetical protein
LAWSTLDELRDSASRSRRSAGSVWIPLAAAAVLALMFLLVPLTTDETAPEPRWRTTAPALDWSSAETRVTFTPETMTLRWPGGPEGARFDLRVSDANLDILDRVRGLDQPEYTLRAESLAGLEPGATVLWQVEAVLPDGSRVSSPTFEATWSPAQE